MKNFTKEELEFVKECLKNKVPKSRFVSNILHMDHRSFNKRCLANGFEYPNFRKNKI